MDGFQTQMRNNFSHKNLKPLKKEKVKKNLCRNKNTCRNKNVCRKKNIYRNKNMTKLGKNFMEQMHFLMEAQCCSKSDSNVQIKDGQNLISKMEKDGNMSAPS